MAVKDRSDGASSAGLEGNNAWDAAFSEGREFGNTLTGEPGTDTPQSATESSAGESSPADVQTPREPIGDDGAEPSIVAQPSDSPLPVRAAEPVDPNADPLAGSEPFTYTVGDQSKTFDGALRIPGDGLYVPEDRVADVQQRLARGEELEQVAKHLEGQNAQWERLTSHTIKDAQGADQTLTGVRGLEALRFEAVADKAALRAVVKVLSDPAEFANLVDYVKIDAQGNQVHPDSEGPGIRWFPVRNESAWKALVRDSSVSVRELRLQVGEQMRALHAPPPPPEPSVSDMALPTVRQMVAQQQVTGLTPQDEQFLAGQLERYVRPATPQERAAYGSPRIVDASFVALVKDRAALRAEAAKALTTGTKANSFNKGMDKGRVAPASARSAAPASPAPTGRLAPKVKSEPSANDAWANLVREAQSVI